LLDAEPHELRCIEASSIEYLRGLMFESVEYYDTKQTWHDTISFLLGELSGQIFPAPGASGMGNTTPETPAHNPK